LHLFSSALIIYHLLFLVSTLFFKIFSFFQNKDLIYKCFFQDTFNNITNFHFNVKKIFDFFLFFNFNVSFFSFHY